MKTKNTIPDYKLAATELDDYFKSLGLSSTTAGGQLERDTNKWERRRFVVGFKPSNITIHPVTFVWRMGTGLKGHPNAAEVLAVCCREYQDAKQESFEDWASNLGYDTDSRKAESTYRECLDIGRKLKEMKLTSVQIDKLAELSARL